jgi:glycerophosphoryl diester phosphodiesterase
MSIDEVTGTGWRRLMHLRNGIIVAILGHRGEGATDSRFCQERDANERSNRLPENTIASQRQCLLQGAIGFELDAIQTKDHHIVCTHTDEVRHHIVIDYSPPEKYIGRMDFETVRGIPVGVNGAGRIDSLEETLLMAQREFPGALVNIELKGKISNFEDPATSSPSLCDSVMNAVEKVNYPLEEIIFSSFSHRYLMEMACICPRAKLGMLCDALKHVGEPLYADADGFIDQVAAFDTNTLEKTLAQIPSLFSIHPEISSVSEESLRYMVEKNLNLYCWALSEIAPAGPLDTDQSYANSIIRVVNLAQAVGMKEVAFITDHVQAVRSLLQQSFGEI